MGCSRPPLTATFCGDSALRPPTWLLSACQSVLGAWKPQAVHGGRGHLMPVCHIILNLNTPGPRKACYFSLKLGLQELAPLHGCRW